MAPWYPCLSMTQARKRTTRSSTKNSFAPYVLHFAVFSGVFLLIIGLALFTLRVTSAATL